MKDHKRRCPWPTSEPIYLRYHDEEWGVPVFDDQRLFEMLILEGAQAGLSWITVLKKRENYRKAFADFDAKKISRFNARKISSLLKNEGIIRNKLKIESVITNAKAFIAVQNEFGSFSGYIWQFAPKTTRRRHSFKEIPARTAESDAMSRDLKKRGFRFVGSTICYAYMQAVGMVNDHVEHCFRCTQVEKKHRKRRK